MALWFLYFFFGCSLSTAGNMRDLSIAVIRVSRNGFLQLLIVAVFLVTGSASSPGLFKGLFEQISSIAQQRPISSPGTTRLVTRSLTGAHYSESGNINFAYLP